MDAETRSSRRSSEDGYSLVVLVIAVTVLNILVAAMLPLWSTAIQREKEEELIFRGFQYAEAIRVYRMRYQHPPNRLEELIEVKPRCIRQLWKDPMTEDGKWAIIFENGPQGPLQIQQQGPDPEEERKGRGGRQEKPGENEGEEPPVDDGRPQLGIRKGEQVQVGPIVGVHSKSGKKSKLLFYGRERYDEWQFTENLLTNTQNVNVGGAGLPPPPGGLTFSTRWLGRPMPGFDQQPVPGVQDGTLPDGTTPGKPGGTRKPGGTSKPRGLP
jgi:type II secretory pathway pseudopilin PulG